jgi:hypothetical protein
VAHPASIPTRIFLQVIRPGREDHTYLYLVPILRMSGAIHLLCLSVPPCAFTVWTKQDFVYKTYIFSALVGIYIYIYMFYHTQCTVNHLQSPSIQRFCLFTLYRTLTQREVSVAAFHDPRSPGSKTLPNNHLASLNTHAVTQRSHKTNSFKKLPVTAEDLRNDDTEAFVILWLVW